MRIFFCILMIMSLLCSCAGQADNKIKLDQVSPPPLSADIWDKSYDGYERYGIYTPINFDVQKSVWISYIDLREMLSGRSEDSFKSRFSEACKNISDLGCNTVYVHVRAFGDAYYASELFPWSKDITGSYGKEPDFDPLEIMVSVAHSYGLSFHAWINPLRCETDELMSTVGEQYSIAEWYYDPEKYKEYLVYVPESGRYWLDPAISEVRSLISYGAAEIVENYEVDGIHIDDYFYPTIDAYFDQHTYSESGTELSLNDWRLENCSAMVREIYSAVKKADPQVLMGISPQGNISSNYSNMFADVKLWCSEEGYADYIVPQLYYGYEDDIKPFDTALAEWKELSEDGCVRFVIGLAPYKIGAEEEYTKDVGIISKQIEGSTYNIDNCGIALYNYINLFGSNENSARMEQEREKISEALSLF